MIPRLLLPLLLLLTGCPDAHEPLRQRVASVQAWVESYRGLALGSPAVCEILGEEEFRAALARLAPPPDPAEVAVLSDVLGALGLVDPGTDLMPLYEAAPSVGVGAFYDPDRRALVLWDGLGSHQEEILAHEITHALQDARFGLGSFTPAQANSDEALALRALPEGDATLVQGAWRLGLGQHLDATQAEWDRVLGDLAGEAQARGAGLPEYLALGATFPYTAGAALARAMVERSALDRALEEPPRSTREVLHPGAAPGEALEPVEPPLGWEPLWSDVLGEALTAVLLGRWADRALADQVAAGLLGDRVQAFDRQGGIVLLWRTRWEEPHGLREIWNARVASLWPEAVSQVADEDEGLWLLPGGLCVYLRIDGLGAIIIEGATEEEAWGLEGSLP